MIRNSSVSFKKVNLVLFVCAFPCPYVLKIYYYLFLYQRSPWYDSKDFIGCPELNWGVLHTWPYPLCFFSILREAHFKSDWTKEVILFISVYVAPKKFSFYNWGWYLGILILIILVMFCIILVKNIIVVKIIILVMWITKFDSCHPIWAPEAFWIDFWAQLQE